MLFCLSKEAQYQKDLRIACVYVALGAHGKHIVDGNEGMWHNPLHESYSESWGLCQRLHKVTQVFRNLQTLYSMTFLSPAMRGRF